MNIRDQISINTEEEFKKAEALANGKYKEHAHTLRQHLLDYKGDPNLSFKDLMLSEENRQMIGHLKAFSEALKEANATKEERMLLVDWVFLTAVRIKHSH